jgi:hypothetical protein
MKPHNLTRFLVQRHNKTFILYFRWIALVKKFFVQWQKELVPMENKPCK